MNMVSKKVWVAALVGASIVFMGSQVRASLLAPSGTSYPLPAGPGPIGGIPQATLTSPITSANFTGTLTSEVILNDATNPFGPGKLTFTYLLQNDSTSSNEMGRLTVSDFVGVQTDASYQGPTTGLLPTLANRDAAGGVIGFSFISGIGPGVLLPGMTSALMVVQTDATVYSRSIASVIDGTVATVSSFAPASGGGVPEPATLSLVALGGGMLLRRRRRA